ncbi:hypothetical protein JMG10_26845 [Nostoc ellipsosporum NOK]|uniref:hypothetical protein n=1 Tax=Sphingomonas sp. IBVSS2 TaxID=1985172 RepID=UPI0015C4F8EE|nr:hypothetical protein [Sphingomonas sp. IBVSS2]MDF2385117.1 hypothetical protein [Nostoc ellipsosporum NOK]
MGLLKIDLGEIPELGTGVALHGALRAAQNDVDDLFELIVGIAILIYEIAPDFA